LIGAAGFHLEQITDPDLKKNSGGVDVDIACTIFGIDEIYTGAVQMGKISVAQF
jgi:hypothetical protein